ncbi:hypothetical protein Tco_0832474, partial [Tanacetum coccineum]
RCNGDGGVSMAESRGCGDDCDGGDGGATGGGSEGGVGGGGRWRDRDDVVKVAAIVVWCSVGCRQSGEGCGVGGSGVGWRGAKVVSGWRVMMAAATVAGIWPENRLRRRNF